MASLGIPGAHTLAATVTIMVQETEAGGILPRTAPRNTAVHCPDPELPKPYNHCNKGHELLLPAGQEPIARQLFLASSGSWQWWSWKEVLYSEKLSGSHVNPEHNLFPRKMEACLRENTTVATLLYSQFRTKY